MFTVLMDLGKSNTYATQFMLTNWSFRLIRFSTVSHQEWTLRKTVIFTRQIQMDCIWIY